MGYHRGRLAEDGGSVVVQEPSSTLALELAPPREGCLLFAPVSNGAVLTTDRFVTVKYSFSAVASFRVVLSARCWTTAKVGLFHDSS